METAAKKEHTVSVDTVETAMCIWEWVLEQLAAGNLMASYVCKWREAVQGTACLRAECLDLAAIIEAEIGKIANEHGPVAWNDPFDWEIVPAIMHDYLVHSRQKKFHADPDMLRRIVRLAWEEDNVTAQVVAKGVE